MVVFEGTAVSIEWLHRNDILLAQEVGLFAEPIRRALFVDTGVVVLVILVLVAKDLNCVRLENRECVVALGLAPQLLGCAANPELSSVVDGLQDLLVDV